MSKKTKESSESGPKALKINRDLLAKINLARKEATNHGNLSQTHRLKSEAAEAAVRLMVGEALASFGVPIIGNALCLSCGSIRPEPVQGQPVQACGSCGSA